MTNKSLRQLFQESRNLNLSEKEKLKIFENLKKYAAGADVRNGNLARHHLWSKLNPFKIKNMPILLAILIALGGGTSFAAQSSLPGDVLYPVKVDVNEQVSGWFALTPQAKAANDAAIANTRLTEAEELAAQGRLNSNVKAQLEANFQAHADKAQAEIKNLENSDAAAAANVSNDFATSLKAHEQILTSIGISKDASTQPEVNALLVKVKLEDKDTEDSQASASAKVNLSPDVQAAAQGRMNAAQNKINEVQKFLTRFSLDATASAQAQARLTLAQNLFAQGQAQLKAGNYAQAFNLFGQSISTAQEAQMLLNAKVHFEGEDNGQGTSSPSMSPLPASSVSPSPRETENNQGDNGGDNSGDHGSSEGHVRINLGF